MNDLPQRPSDVSDVWITEADVARAATLIISLRGAAAAHHASRRAMDLHLTGSFEAEAIWRRIAKAIEQLQAQMSAGSGP